MTTNAEYVLAKQSGDAAFYAAVEVQVDVVAITERTQALDISPPSNAPADWCRAVEFGIHYAGEHLPRSQRFGKKYAVTVISIKGHPVDTTLIVIAFAAAKAFWKAVGSDGPAGFELDVSARVFHVPK